MSKLILPTALLACTGCGTVVNLATPAREGKVYGGVRTDIQAIEKLVEGGDASGGPLSSPGSGAGALFALAFVALPVLDLPLSVVGDTLTLPLTRWLDGR